MRSLNLKKDCCYRTSTATVCHAAINDYGCRQIDRHGNSYLVTNSDHVRPVNARFKANLELFFSETQRTNKKLRKIDKNEKKWLKHFQQCANNVTQSRPFFFPRSFNDGVFYPRSVIWCIAGQNLAPASAVERNGRDWSHIVNSKWRNISESNLSNYTSKNVFGEVQHRFDISSKIERHKRAAKNDKNPVAMS